MMWKLLKDIALPSFNYATVTASYDVENRLTDFGVSREQLIEIGKTARTFADDASPNMPQNAPGMLSYIYGVSELRQQFVGSEYLIDRKCGIEAMIKRDRTLRIGFQNVDKCCDSIPPIPRSEKGAGAASLSGPTLFQHAGVEEGPLTGVKADGILTYYVMVGLDGSVELSCPIIDKGKYISWRERIYIYSPDADWDVLSDINNDPIDEFDISVSFKEQ